MTDWVFGYGSLVTDVTTLSDQSEKNWSWASLEGHRRSWGVGMENAATDADLKYYIEESGVRPDIVVAFLDVYALRGSSTNGVIFAVDDHRLREFDRREVRYERVEVTSQVNSADVAPRRVWTYRGKPRARDVLRKGRADGRAFVSRGYMDYCRSGFARGGDESMRAFAATTDPLDLPLRELKMVTRHSD